MNLKEKHLFILIFKLKNFFRLVMLEIKKLLDEVL
jgi:hypothetical protein